MIKEPIKGMLESDTANFLIVSIVANKKENISITYDYDWNKIEYDFIFSDYYISIETDFKGNLIDIFFNKSIKGSEWFSVFSTFNN